MTEAERRQKVVEFIERQDLDGLMAFIDNLISAACNDTWNDAMRESDGWNAS